MANSVATKKPFARTRKADEGEACEFGKLHGPLCVRNSGLAEDAIDFLQQAINGDPTP